MDNFITVLYQVIMLIILILTGYVCSKKKIITERGKEGLLNVLLIITVPCVIINSFQRPFEKSEALFLLISAIIAVITHLVGIVLGTIIFRKQPDREQKVLKLGIVYSNCGFMCIPLLDAVLGANGVFYGSAYIAIFNILLWSQGIIVLSGSKKDLSVKKILLNPGTSGVIIAIPLFLLSIKLPIPLGDAVKQISNLNTPLAMLLTGVFLANTDLKKAFTNNKVYLASFLRLIVVPAIMFLALMPFHLDNTLFTACIIPASAPIAASIPIMAEKYDGDSSLASTMVSVSTLFSVITMPVFILLALMVK